MAEKMLVIDDDEIVLRLCQKIFEKEGFEVTTTGNPEEGLKLAPASEMAPLGHYVLADVYNRRGRPGDAAREVAMARSLEAKRPASR